MVTIMAETCSRPYAVYNTIDLHFCVRSCWLYFSYNSCIYVWCLKENTNSPTRQPVCMSIIDTGAPPIGSRGASRYSMTVYLHDLNPTIALMYCVQDVCGWLLNASLYTYHIRWLMKTGHVHFHKAQKWTLWFLGVTEQNIKNYSSFHWILDISRITHFNTWRGDPKIPGIVKKNLFKVFLQIWNFSPLRSSPPATGCSNPSTAPNSGNIV